MRCSFSQLAAAAALSASLVSGLLVAPGSPCSSSCGNVLSSTSPDEMVCSASGYTGTSPGVVFQNCVKCESTSSYVSGTQSDTQAMLHNLRVNVGYCLFGDLGNKNVQNNPCITRLACEPFKDRVAIANYSKSVGTFDYCSGWRSDRVPNCASCLAQLDNGQYLANYITILEAGCQQRPTNGSTVSFSGNPFGNTQVVITEPTPTYATIPTPDYGPVSLGARVGIAFGGLAFILVILGFCVVLNGKRRRRAFLRDLERRQQGQGWPHPKTRYGNNGDMLETPASQKPLTGWDESPVSAHPDNVPPMPRYFSPYNSNYNSPISAGAQSSAGVNWPTLSPQKLDELIQEQSPAHGSPPPAFTQWPSPAQEKLMVQMHHRQNEIAIGLALGGDEASLRSKNSNGSMNNNPYTNGLFTVSDGNKGKKRDEMYEMHEVESPYSGGNSFSNGYKMPQEPQAPVLHHPGYGRHHAPRPSTGLSEQEMRNGGML